MHMYNVHINGNFHCSLRYRQFLGLHEQLRKEFGAGRVPQFPPKKFLSLSAVQLEEPSQNSEIASSELFTGFLRLAQHETSGEPVAKRPIDVFLPNGHQMTVDVWNNAPTTVLFKLVSQECKLPDDMAEHFGLYIFRKEPDGYWIVLRKLNEYESPYISIKWLDDSHRIVGWDLSHDDLLMDDRVGLHMLYVQMVSDIENGWIIVPKEVLVKQLTALQSQGSKKEYVRVARRLKFYGYMKFPYCQSDFLQPSSELTVYIGNRELVVITPRREEISFKVTRMKCWRITLHHERNGDVKAELSFEYLQSKDKLEWITLMSEQSVIMALCLQEIVADMVAKQHPTNPSLIGVRSVKTMFYYIRRDGDQVPLNDDIIVPKNNGTVSLSNCSSGNSSPTTHSLSNGCSTSAAATPTSSLTRNNSYDVPSTLGITKRRPSNNSLCRQSSVINSTDNLFHENSAFAGIGDDDL
ncbi:Sorting nexin-17 [Orchesella cincta]|uniref:Sorting nexin-17 n=1 Tax=Orchesella cincta TaxID=48709 RepID=A0A1D2N3Y4_ORCCI|nr:Sorting nexin-17 [Orchesella cincta]